MRYKDVRAAVMAEVAARIEAAAADGHDVEPDKWRPLSGRRALRAMKYGRNVERPSRSRLQRKTAEQRLAHRKVRPHEKRKANRRARRQAVVETAA